MRRAYQFVLYTLMIALATVAGFMSSEVTLAPIKDYLESLSGAATMAVFGLIAGLAIAWACHVDWQAFPHRFRHWMQLQRSRFWWLTTGLASISVLLFY